MLRRVIIPVLALTVLLFASLLSADLSFDARRDFYAGDYPRDVGVGDFNGDGHQDLAIPLKEDEEVGVLLGNGDGTFQPVQDYATGPNYFDSYPYSVAIGKLDDDDHDDMVIANANHNDIGIMINQGDGTFAEGDTMLIGGWPNCVILEDFNEDGELDVVTANFYGNNVTIVLGDGAGDFAPPAVPFYAVGVEPYTVASGDFNEDDDLDLAVANFGGDDFSVLLGNGDGSFGPAVDYPAGDAPHGIALADFDGDDHMDIAIPNRESDDVSVLLGAGDGSFSSHAVLPTGEKPYGIATGDFNDDDDPDLVVCSRYDDNVHVYLGDGQGGFATSVTYECGEEPYAVGVGDFNEDQVPDLAVASREGEDVSILFGLGDGTFRDTPSYVSGDTPGQPVVADFNGDMNPDIAVANYGSEDIGVLLGAGDGTFAYDDGYAAGDFPVALAAGHFNGDEYLDLAAVACNDRWMTVLLADGDGTFRQGTGFSSVYPNGMAAAELDGRNGTDLVVSSGTARSVTVYTCNGDGTFATAGSCTTGGSQWWSAYRPVVGDFDEDTTPDLVVPVGHYSDGHISFLKGAGDGSFSFQAVYSSGGEGTGGADAGYVDGDAHLDVVAANVNSGTVSVFLGNGDGSFQPALTETIGIEPTNMRLRDFDGDGELDVVAASSDDGGGILVVLGNGDGTFGEPRGWAGGEGSFQLDVGDFNRDSRLDVVGSNNWSDNISIYINTSPDTPVEQSFYATATADGSVMVRWLLSSFDDARALRLYRATSMDGPFEFLSEHALPDAAYGEYEDTTAWSGGTFWYDLRAVLHDGSEASFVQYLPSVTLGGSLALAMRAPTPNPFASQCSFSIDIPSHDGAVRLDVYNVRGQLVRTLVDEPMPAGRYSVSWDGRDTTGRQSASGVYFLRLGVGAAHVEEKAILLR